MFVDEKDELHHVGSTNDMGRNLEEAQLATGEGPCVDTYVQDQIITSADVHRDPRWPALAAHLSAGWWPSRASRSGLAADRSAL